MKAPWIAALGVTVAWFFMRVPKGREPFVQKSVPTWYSPMCDANGNVITSHVMNQDFVAWVGQGRIADRTKENLAASDAGIVMIRMKVLVAPRWVGLPILISALKFGIPVAISNLFGWLAAQGIRFVVQYGAGPTALAGCRNCPVRRRRRRRGSPPRERAR